MLKPCFIYFSVLVLLCIGLSNCTNEKQQEKQAPTTNESTLFTVLDSEQTAVDFVNEIPESSAMNSMVYEYFYNGAGVAIGDIDNDGLEDIYFVSNLKENKLYKNKGNLVFEDITQKAGVAGGFGWSTGVCMADVNADGWLDIYVCKSGKGKAEHRRNELYINNKNGSFTEAAASYGLDFEGYSTQAAFFDYDKDGDLDAFLLNHNVSPINTNHPEEYKQQIAPLVGDKLYRNDNGRFTDVSQAAGLLNNPLGFGLGIAISDINNDNWPDIYITNDYIEHDYLYINQGNGQFKEQSQQALKHTSFFSMGTDMADFNNDGWTDIVALDMVAEDNYSIKTSMSGMNPAAFDHAVQHGFQHQYMFNTIQLNNGTSQQDLGLIPLFSELAQLSGISNTDWSWAALFADFDNDGWKDIFISNGLKRDFRNNDFRKHKLKRIAKAKQTGEKMSAVIEELVAQTPTRAAVNYFYKNEGDLRFSKQSATWGSTHKSLSQGAAYADLDNDGDLDLVTNNIDSPAYIYQNNSQQNYLQITLKGEQKNPFGIGCKLNIYGPNSEQTLEHYPSRGYQSSVGNTLHFGLGTLPQIDSLHIHWPDGKQEALYDIKSNQRLELDYQNATRPAIKQLNNVAPFKTLAQLHLHRENEYNDFEKESLLPHKMSAFGPALAVGDVDDDGLEDFFIGGAKDHAAALYIQNKDGTFKATSFDLWQAEKAYEDVAASFFDADNDGDLDLYVVSGGNEFAEDSPMLQDRLYLNDGKKNLIKNDKLLPTFKTSGSCVKPFDFDQDGDLDLFVGGRLVSGKYAFPASSYLLQNDGGIFKDVTQTLAPALDEIGMVTDAMWSDVDQDNQTDLILVGEWMPITILTYQEGTFNINAATPLLAALEQSDAWWFSIDGADFDQDGDTDYVLGNLGLNYKYKASKQEPFEIYCHDFDQNNTMDIVLGYYNQGDLFPLRGRECSSNQMPFLKEKFPSYHDFGQADLSEVYGEEQLAQALHLQAYSFASIYLENKGNAQFTSHALPTAAQLSSINDFIIYDWNADGVQEVISAGNLYQSEVETPRNDASMGLLMNFDRQEGFQAVPAAQSGLYLDGDVKKMALIQLANRDKAAILLARNNDYLELVVYQ